MFWRFALSAKSAQSGARRRPGYVAHLTRTNAVIHKLSTLYSSDRLAAITVFNPCVAASQELVAHERRCVDKHRSTQHPGHLSLALQVHLQSATGRTWRPPTTSTNAPIAMHHTGASLTSLLGLAPPASARLLAGRSEEKNLLHIRNYFHFLNFFPTKPALSNTPLREFDARGDAFPRTNLQPGSPFYAVYNNTTDHRRGRSRGV